MARRRSQPAATRRNSECVRQSVLNVEVHCGINMTLPQHPNTASCALAVESSALPKPNCEKFRCAYRPEQEGKGTAAV